MAPGTEEREKLAAWPDASRENAILSSSLPKPKAVAETRLSSVGTERSDSKVSLPLRT
jgi:hypothetical protein